MARRARNRRTIPEDRTPTLLETIVVTTSAAFGAVAEAFVALELGAHGTSSSQPRDEGRALTHQGIVAGVPWRTVSAAASLFPGISLAPRPDTVQAPTALTAMSGMSLLRGLSTISASSLSTFVAQNPAALRELLDFPPPATEVTTWWATLDTAARSSLMAATPQLVGNLDGVPLTSRGAANIAFLERSAEEVGGGIGSRGRGERFPAMQQLLMFDEIEKALEPGEDGESRTLLSFDPSGSGTAAVVIGDLDSADYVTLMVPGAFVLVSGQIVEWSDSAQALHEEQLAWIDRHWSESRDKPTVATVAWIGYTTPGPLEVTKLDLAREGRDALASVIQGLQAERAGDGPFLSVIAHSYGSTAAMMALTEYELSIDALAVVGSPGGLVSTVGELAVRDNAVFVGDAPWDPVAGTGFFGADPGLPSFGARLFGVAGGRADPLTGLQLAPAMMHSSYLDRGSESLRNLALISLGLGSEITTGD